jgi:hypothetical protein
VKTHSVFSTDASFLLGDLFEQEGVLELLPFFGNNVDMEIAITDVTVSDDKRLGRSPKFLKYLMPILHIEGNIV